MKNKAAIFLSVLFFCSCGGKNTDEPVEEPGSEKSAKSKTLETGAEILQAMPPVQALSTYLNGFHFYSGNMKGQMEAHHYCNKLNEDVTQCIIYDGNEKDAHIMGVEYIISERLFNGLPDEEKKLWHTHAYEVKSGTLVAPGIPEVAEHELMEQIVSTYGKTWHTWHTDLHKDLPYGSPQLMMSFIADGQLADSLVVHRDERLNVDTKKKRESRSDIPTPKKIEGADHWTKGKAIQLPELGSPHSHQH